jgi:hypothetical protein
VDSGDEQARLIQDVAAVRGLKRRQGDFAASERDNKTTKIDQKESSDPVVESMGPPLQPIFSAQCRNIITMMNLFKQEASKRKQEHLDLNSITSLEDRVKATCEEDENSTASGSKSSKPSDNNPHALYLKHLKNLETFLPTERSPEQKLFHFWYTLACLPIIYGKNWSQHAQFLLKAHGVKDIQSTVFVTAPRRFGKTVSIALFVASLVLLKTINIAIISTTQRQSKWLAQQAINHIKQYVDEDGVTGKSRIVAENGESVVICPAEKYQEAINDRKKGVSSFKNDPSNSVLNFFPSNSTGSYCVFCFVYKIISR